VYYKVTITDLSSQHRPNVHVFISRSP
jgi:hypothetical protein